MTQNPQEKVAEIKQRNYAQRIAKFWLGERKQTMPKQAKTLTQQNLKQVLDYVAQHKHALRNRTMLLVTHWAGMRVGEVANLRYANVVDHVGKIRDEIQLEHTQTKGRHARTVFVNAKLPSVKLKSVIGFKTEPVKNTIVLDELKLVSDKSKLEDNPFPDKDE